MDSFQAIYRSHFDTLYEYGMRLIHNPDLVKDAIQDLFVKLWNNKSNLGDVTAVRSYLLVALRSIIFNKLEKSKRFEFYDQPDLIPFEMEFSAELIFIKKETNKLQIQGLLAALSQLTERQKEVIYLRYFHEMSYEDIASALQITVKGTYKLVARGIGALRHAMNVPLYLLLFWL